jgi:molybdate transport system substrate-binding protein
MRPSAFLSIVVAAVVALAPCAGARAQPTALTVFAAASLKNALDDANTAYRAKSNLKVVASYAASSALVRQIEQGAPADVFVSADTDWMDYAAQRKLIRAETRFDLLGNRLVLIAPKGSRLGAVAIGPGFDLAALAGGGRVVTGDVRAVPAGRYAKAALERLGVWQVAEPRLAMAENVRAALSLVARGEAGLGIVYETDAKAEPGVKVIGTFPEDIHPPIVYPAAATATARPTAREYLAFLRSPDAAAIFRRHGFTILAKPTS